MSNWAKFLILSLLAALQLGVLTGCASTRASSKNPIELKPFVSDGCSLFPNGTCSDKDEWRECCVEHDRAYWIGGTKADRKKADARLEECVCKQSGKPGLARTMHDGVRVFGAPASPTWYRWGYGWKYGRKYKALTKDELEQVRYRLLEEKKDKI